MRVLSPRLNVPLRTIGAAGAGIGVALASLTAVAAGPAAVASAAQCATLGPAWQYGLFAPGDAFLQDTDSTLPVAVGGDATLTSYAADSSQKLSNTNPALVVGGRLSTVDGGSAFGKVFVGTPPIEQTNGGFTFNTPLLATSPLSFSSALTSLQAESSSLAAQAQTSGATVTSATAGNGNTLTLTGAPGASFDVFNLSAATIATAHSIKITGTPGGATVVVNVAGTTFAGASVSSIGSGTSVPSTNLLWNFPTATSLTFGSSGWYGTILAPVAATAAATFAQIDGSVLVGGSLGTSGAPWTAEVDTTAFAGCLPPAGPPAQTPEGLPATFGASLAVVGGGYLLWRRRRTAAVA